MHNPARYLLPLAAAALMACTSVPDEDDAEDTQSAVSSDRVLTEAECKQVSLANRATAPGTFQGALDGCVLGRGGETGDALAERALAIVGDPRRLADMRKVNGTKMWTKFEPSGTVGSVNPGNRLAFDASLGIDIAGPFDAKGTVSFLVERRQNGNIALTIQNRTGIGAAGATVIEPGKLRIALEVVPARNGIVIKGSVDVTLARFQSHSGSVSNLGPQIVQWLDRELAPR
jgi:hypothetical protein